MNKLHCLILALAFLMAGCVSTIPSTNMPRLAPSRPDMATVYVIDDIGGPNWGTGELIVINGERIGPLSRREYTWFYQSPGTMDLSMNDPSIKSRKMSARRLTVEAGKTYYISYKIMTRKSDGQLLGDIFAGSSKNAISFDPEDLQVLTENEAEILIGRQKLAGNTKQGLSNQPLHGTPAEAPSSSTEPEGRRP